MNTRYVSRLGEAAAASPAGANNGAPATKEEGYKVVINQTLNPGDTFNDLRQAIDGDGDFVATGVYGSSTGTYTILFRNPGLRAMSSTQVNNVNAIGTAQFPVPFGGVQYPAGGQISYGLTNTSGAINVIQIIIDGIKIRNTSR